MTARPDARARDPFPGGDDPKGLSLLYIQDTMSGRPLRWQERDDPPGNRVDGT